MNSAGFLGEVVLQNKKPGFDLLGREDPGIASICAQNTALGVGSSSSADLVPGGNSFYSLKCLKIYCIPTSDTYLHHIEYTYGIIYRMWLYISML